MLPAWADALILLGLPLILGLVLWKWGGTEPDNGITHDSQDDEPPVEMAAA
jgi:hypothetical protein